VRTKKLNDTSTFVGNFVHIVWMLSDNVAMWIWS